MPTPKKLPTGPIGLLRAIDKGVLVVMPLFPTQRELLLCAEECVRSIYCIGRRSGKTTCGAILLVWMALLRPDLRRYVQPDERIYHVAVGANREQARIVLNSAKRIVKASPLLTGMVERETDEELHFTNGSTIAAFVCSSRTTRGWPIATLVLDEFAFFQTTDEGPAAAANVYRALVPSLAQFGDDRRLVLSSTPNGPGTFKVHFDAANEAEENGDSNVGVFQLPTWGVRPDIPASVYDEERTALGELFDAEFGAQFLASGGALLSEADIRSCIVPGGDLSPQEITDAVCGLDVGWRRDRSAAVILGRDHKEPERLRVAAIRTWAPARDKALGVERHAEAVLAEVAALARSYGAAVHADTYESATTRARLEAHGVYVELTSTGAGTKGAMYRDLAQRIRLGQIEYPDEPILIAELRRLRVSYRGASTSVENPRSGDSHGDVAAALAMAAFNLTAESGGPVFAELAVPSQGSLSGDYDDELGGGAFGGGYDDGTSNPIDSWSLDGDW